MKKSLLFISAVIAGATSFAQEIPNGNFTSWTVDAATGWSSAVNFESTSADPNINPLCVIALSAKPVTNQGTKGVGKNSSMIVHSAAIAGGKYLPGVSISGPNAYVRINQDLKVQAGFPPCGPNGAPVLTSWGSFAVTPGTVVPKTLSGFARYRTKAGSANRGSIAVLIFGNNGDTVGTYAPGIFFIDSVAATKGFVNFNIPITATYPTCDSIKIVLTTSDTVSTNMPDVADTLWVDRLRFFSCQVDPSLTLLTPGIKSDDGNAGLNAEPTLTLTPNAAYSHTFTFSIPDPTIGSIYNDQLAATADYTLTPLDSVDFTDVDVSSAAGLVFTQGYPSGIAYGNSLYCYSVSGTIPAAANETYILQVAQTPYGIVSVASNGSLIGTTTSPDGSLFAQPVSFHDLVVDSITIVVGTGVHVGIDSFNASGDLTLSNSPNPFSGSTKINFTCPTSGSVDFVVVDVLGRQVYNTNISATVGSNTFTYTTDLASGTYFFSITDGTDKVTGKMVISK